MRRKTTNIGVLGKKDWRNLQNSKLAYFARGEKNLQSEKNLRFVANGEKLQKANKKAVA